MLATLALAALAACGQGIPATRPHERTADTDWVGHDGDASASNYSGLERINQDNVHRLGLAWSLDLEGEHYLAATPLAIDGVLYFTGSMSKAYAVDATNGKVIWTYDPQNDGDGRAGGHMAMPTNRGMAYADGKVFFGTNDGRLIALDSHTGRRVWSAQTFPHDDLRYAITGAPLAFKGKVLIGHGGGDTGARGYVTAYDAQSGQQVWRFYTVPGTPEENARDPTLTMIAKTWSGKYWEVGTGGAVWNAMTYDAELDRLYIGVSNGSPFNSKVRSPGGGDNLFLASIVALNPDTGRYIWHYQMNPLESWDYKCTATITLATLDVNGQPHKVLMQSPTNGFFYVIDRATGKLLSAEKIGKVTWAERIDLETGRPIETPNIRYERESFTVWPSSFGAHNWQAMSFNPEAGLAYIPYMQLGMRLDTGAAAQKSGAPVLGGMAMSAVIEDSEDGKGALLAWDPLKQTAAWKVRYDSFWNGGVMTTAGGLAFQGTGDGAFAAFNAATGQKLWEYDAKLGIVAAPITYLVQGTQYVSVLVGYGGPMGMWPQVGVNRWKYGAEPRRLLTFALDHKAQLPPNAVAAGNFRALDDPSIRIDQAQASAGRTLYHQTCVPCHGFELRSPGAPGPDLRESAIALDPVQLGAVVRDGALTARGMPRFDTLSQADVQALYMYIRRGAREAVAGRRPAEASGRAQTSEPQSN